MLLSSVHFKNYGTLDDLELHFTQGINVLFGVNGTGKTIILHALKDVLNALSFPKAGRTALQSFSQRAEKFGSRPLSRVRAADTLSNAQRRE